MVDHVQLQHFVLHIKIQHSTKCLRLSRTIGTPGKPDDFRDSAVINAVYIDFPNSGAMCVVPQAHSVMATQARYDNNEVFIRAARRI